jgi:Uma2 family endonuclease
MQTEIVSENDSRALEALMSTVAEKLYIPDDLLTLPDRKYIPPDLAVEVVSPNDLAYDVESKVVEYLDANVALVWVIDPEARTVRIYRRDGSISWLREQGELSGEDVLPGFQCRVATIFPEKTAGKPAAS